MSTLIITRAKLFTSIAVVLFAFSAMAEEWKVDFSRRFPEPKKDEIREPASERPIQTEEAGGNSGAAATPGFFEAVFQNSDPSQEIVVMNTDKGFIPSQIRVRQGQNYKIYIVNVNENEKNVSFVLDSFSEHHATYYGKIKSFMIHPQKEGVYRFLSPETSAQGKLVVVPEEKNGRLPASP